MVKLDRFESGLNLKFSSSHVKFDLWPGPKNSGAVPGRKHSAGKVSKTLFGNFYF